MMSLVPKRNYTFYALFALWLAVGCFALLFISQGDAVILINGSHNNLLDILVTGTNFLGDGLFFAIVGVALLFIKLRYGLLALVTLAFTGAVVQLLKRMVFFNSMRPIVYLKDVYELHVVDGFTMYSMHSFPSGHSTTAFALFCTLALLFNKPKILSVLFVILAILAGLSRIYLGQHFLQDVLAGSVLGVVIASITYGVFSSTLWYNHAKVANQSIIKLFAREA